jgi:hypothetical protein
MTSIKGILQSNLDRLIGGKLLKLYGKLFYSFFKSAMLLSSRNISTKIHKSMHQLSAILDYYGH